MKLQLIIQQALLHNQWNIAIDQLENAVLQGIRIEEAQLELVPSDLLAASPLLQKAICENLCDQGQLAEAKELLLDVTKKLAALGLRGQLLSSLALLAVINIRMGLVHEAEPVIRFLVHEEEAGGDVAYAVARGFFLLDINTAQYERYYRSAVQAYDREEIYQRGSAVLFEMIVLEHHSLTSQQWEERLAEFSLRVKRKQASSPLLDYLLTLRSYAEGKLEQAKLTILRCSTLPAPYEVLLALLRCRIAIDSGELQRSAAYIEQLEQYELDARWDLDYQYEYIEMKFNYELLCGNWQSAKILVSQAKGLLSQGLSDKFAHKINAMNDKLANIKERPKTRVKLFGTLLFVTDQEEHQQLQWKRKKTKELMVFLLLQRDYAAAKEQIAEALFIDYEPKKMANQLYVAAHQLKAVLKDTFGVDEGVVTKDGIVKLRDDWFEEVDVEKYQTLVRVGNQLWLDDRELAVRMYEQAIELYGDVAADFPYADWLLDYREQLSRTQIELFRRICAVALEAKRYEQAELYYRQWVSWLPTDEEANQGLLKLLNQQGKQAEAEALYRQFAEKLRSELGIAPLNETQAILWRDRD